MTPADIHWTTIGAFWMSMLVAVVATSATVINYLFFRSQIDPDIIVHASDDYDRPTLIVLIIENIGKSMAFDVKFETSKPLPKYAFGKNAENAEMALPMDEGPLINGIRALGPGSKRIINWGQYGGLKKYLGNEEIEVTVTYRSQGICPFFHKKHVTKCPLDIKSFEATDASDSNWERKSANELQRIADYLQKMTVNTLPG